MEDEAFLLLKEKVHQAVYAKTQEEKEGAASSSHWLFALGLKKGMKEHFAPTIQHCRR